MLLGDSNIARVDSGYWNLCHHQNIFVGGIGGLKFKQPESNREELQYLHPFLNAGLVSMAPNSLKRIVILCTNNAINTQSSQDYCLTLQREIDLLFVKRPSLDVYVLSILPRRGMTDRISQFNDELENALKFKAAVTFSRLPEFVLASDFLPDNIHLNIHGYHILFAHLFAMLQHPEQLHTSLPFRAAQQFADAQIELSQSEKHALAVVAVCCDGCWPLTAIKATKHMLCKPTSRRNACRFDMSEYITSCCRYYGTRHRDALKLLTDEKKFKSFFFEEFKKDMLMYQVDTELVSNLTQSAFYGAVGNLTISSYRKHVNLLANSLQSLRVIRLLIHISQQRHHGKSFDDLQSYCENMMLFHANPIVTFFSWRPDIPMINNQSCNDTSNVSVSLLSQLYDYIQYNRVKGLEKYFAQHDYIHMQLYFNPVNLPARQQNILHCEHIFVPRPVTAPCGLDVIYQLLQHLPESLWTTSKRNVNRSFLFVSTARIRYTFPGYSLQAKQFPGYNMLMNLGRDFNRHFSLKCNSISIAKYMKGITRSHELPPHRDNEDGIANTFILSVSLGATAKFKLADHLHFLSHGDFVYFDGRTLHSVERIFYNDIYPIRFNLTFRTFHNADPF